MICFLRVAVIKVGSFLLDVRHCTGFPLALTVSINSLQNDLQDRHLALDIRIRLRPKRFH